MNKDFLTLAIAIFIGIILALGTMRLILRKVRQSS